MFLGCGSKLCGLPFATYLVINQACDPQSSSGGNICESGLLAEVITVINVVHNNEEQLIAYKKDKCLEYG